MDPSTAVREHSRGEPLAFLLGALADPPRIAAVVVDFYAKRIDRARRTTHLLRQLHALGYQVQHTDTAA